MMRSEVRSWLVDILIGGLAGGLFGIVVATNLAIYLGVEGGYEADLADVFSHNPLVGVLVVCMLALGPVAGVIIVRALRRQRRGSGRDNTDSR